MTVTATQAEQSYTLAGIVIKLLDTVVSLEEGIRDPELMSDHWRHSGARIYWAERDRGNIVQPLLERLVIEIKQSIADPKYKLKPHHVNSVRLRAGSAIIETVLMYQDMYATQNLAMLAYEYQLDKVQRDMMITLFNDRNVDDEQFSERVLKGIIDDRKLKESVEQGRIPCIGYTTLFAKDAPPDAERCEDAFIAYGHSSLRRQEMRCEMHIDTAEKLGSLAIRQEQVLRLFDRTMVHVADQQQALLEAG